MTAWRNSVGPDLIEAMGWCLVHSVWQAAAVGLVAAFVLRGLKRASAQARYVAACVALAAMLVLPVTTAGLLERSRHEGEVSLVAVDAQAAGPVESDAGNMRSDGQVNPTDRTQPIDGAGDRSDRASSEPPRAGGSRLEPLLPWLVGLWGTGVIVLSLRLFGGWVSIQWLIRHDTAPLSEKWSGAICRLKQGLKLAKVVRLVESARVHVPLTVGWMRPVILLPVTALSGLPADQIEAILAHELAHIRRHDYLVNLVQSVIETLLFYHPAVWWISGRIRVERENCCDDWAVELCGDRLVYSRTLASLEEQRGCEWMLAQSAGTASLLARVRRSLGVAPMARSKRAAWRAHWHWQPSRSWDLRCSSRPAPKRPGRTSRTRMRSPAGWSPPTGVP